MFFTQERRRIILFHRGGRRVDRMLRIPNSPPGNVHSAEDHRQQIEPNLSHQKVKSCKGLNSTRLFVGQRCFGCSKNCTPQLCRPTARARRMPKPVLRRSVRRHKWHRRHLGRGSTAGKGARATALISQYRDHLPRLIALARPIASVQSVNLLEVATVIRKPTPPLSRTR
jgi:hypothetical protein